MLEGLPAENYYMNPSAGTELVYPSTGRRQSDNKYWGDHLVGYSYINSEYRILRFSTNGGLAGCGGSLWWGCVGRICSQSYSGYYAWNSEPNPYGATRCAGTGLLYKVSWY